MNNIICEELEEAKRERDDLELDLRDLTSMASIGYESTKAVHVHKELASKPLVPLLCLSLIMTWVSSGGIGLAESTLPETTVPFDHEISPSLALTRFTSSMEKIATNPINAAFTHRRSESFLNATYD